MFKHFPKIQLLTLVVALISATSFANPVSQEKAKEVALKFIQNNTSLKSSEATLAYTFESLNDNPYLFIFNVADKGFVVVSADDLIGPIVGYSTEGIFSSDDISPEFAYYMNCFTEKIEYLRSVNAKPSQKAVDQWNQIMATGSLTAEKQTTFVNPLVKTKWNQGSYYNNQCPKDARGPSGRVYAGCVACAMSQIMKYWNYPPVGTGSHSYNASSYGTQTANFGETFYDFNAMPLSLSRTSTSKEIFEVSQLMYHCAVSVNMAFGYDGSGANSEDVPRSWKDYFQFSDGTFIDYMMMYSSSTWASKLRQSLDDGYPLYYSGGSEEGGHAFVCDGYDVAGLFHFNWGWGGALDGYFTTDSTFMFPLGQAAIFNATPKYGNNPTTPSDFTLTPDDNYEYLDISWVNPTKNVIGRNLPSSDLTVYLLRNQDTIYTADASVGDTMQFTDSKIPSFGNYTYSLFVTCDTLQGFAIKETIFFGPSCSIKVKMIDKWNDGWGDAKLSFRDVNGKELAEASLGSGESPLTLSLNVPVERTICWWVPSTDSSGYYDKECGFTIYDSNSNVLYSRAIDNPLSYTSFLGFDFNTDCSVSNIDYYGIRSFTSEDVELYPNPASDEITVNSSETINSINIYSIIGQQVYAASPHDNSYTLSVKDLSPGVYITQINTDSGSCAKKLIVK